MRAARFLAPMAFVALALLSPAHAAIYHVAQKAPGASDDNPGTAARPWKSISRAAKALRAGDRVIVHAGTYREYVEPANSGRAKAPITYEAAPQDTVVVTGADVVTGWTRMPGDAPIYRVPWTNVFAIDWHDGKPVEHHPADAPLWGRAEQVIADGEQLKPCASLVDLRAAWAQHQAAGAASRVLDSPVRGLGPKFAGMFAADTTGRKELYLWLADGGDPSKRAMEAATRGMCFGTNPWARPKGFEYVVVRGFIFRYCGTFPQRAAVWLHGAHNVLDRCRIEEMAGSGAAVNGTMRGCTVRACGHTGGGALGKDFANIGCTWTGNCWKPIDRGWDAGGVKLALSSHGLYDRCTFVRNGGPGLWFDIDVHDVEVRSCEFTGNEGSGLFIEISRRITVRDCQASSNGVGLVGEVGPGGWSTAGIQLGESEDCHIVHNVCMRNKDGIAIREQGPRPLQTDDAGTIPYHNRGHVIAGNTCRQNLGYQLALWYDNAYFGWHPSEHAKYGTLEAYDAAWRAQPDKVYDPRRQGMTIDRNAYEAAAGQHLFLYGVPWRPRAQTFDSLAAFRKATGFEEHGQIAPPIAGPEF